MHRLLNDNLGAIRQACRDHRVAAMHAFGSICSDGFNESSDVDILVEFQKMDPVDYAGHFFDLADQLELILGRKVDLVTVNSLANPYFKQAVVSTKTLLYD